MSNPDYQALMTSVPRLKEAFDTRALRLDPFERVIVSRIDGQSTPVALSAAVALPVERVLDALTRLDELGALNWRMSATDRAANPVEKPQGAWQATPILTVMATTPSSEIPAAQATSKYVTPTPIRAQASERDEPAKKPPTNGSKPVAHADGAAAASPSAPELQPAEADAIMRELERHEGATHWEILRVDAEASTGDIKRAYFNASKDFHPDRYYGKRLGLFGERLERLFKRIKLAYDTLSDDETKVRYSVQFPPPPPKPAEPQTNGTPHQASQVHRPAAVTPSRATEKLKALSHPFRRKKNGSPVELDATSQAIALAERQEAEEKARAHEQQLNERREELQARRRKAGLQNRGPKQAPKDYSNRAQDMYDDGCRHLGVGQLNQALSSFKLAVTYASSNAEYQKAYNDLNERYAKARELSATAASLRRKGEIDKAYLQAIEASDLWFEDVALAKEAAEACKAKGENKRALSYVERGLAIAANNSGLHFLAADIFQALGDHRRASEHYAKAAELDSPLDRVRNST